ncbi:hypothetical protein PISMIDRAFT_681601 [Pisolithus microcarpus 441]|uniref:Uncharacterized protein n=1 Tax=Pisolithus microcarpus 441 TaxID=765257 RepID=A0A0C9Y932_9AGAM|nr:hypothetical protein PISMIDRAFT_681601 [Pisolithus microcarpus 441]
MESLLAKECVNRCVGLPPLCGHTCGMWILHSLRLILQISATTSFKRSILVEATNVGPYAALTVQ